LVLYTLAVSASLRVSVLALAGALAAAWATALPDFKALGGAATFSLAYLAVWTVGNARNLHGRYTSDLLNGHIAEERVRIARELHDVLAHQMTVITVQAGYAGLLLDEGIDAATGQRARSALGVIESAGRETLEEMRHLVSVLRSVPGPNEDADAGGLAPTPGLADLPRLVERAAHAGVRVEVAVRGAGRALRAGEDLAAYRIVQEAITNVIRHSGGTTARVTLTYADGELFVEICDDGSGNTRSARANPLGVGRGLAGMRERVRLYGGQLEAGPAAAGGFKVAARLPLAAAANGDT
jgi:signal transduction histidine kinase